MPLDASSVLQALALALAAALALSLSLCCAPMRCFKAARRRADPDHEAVPETPEFSSEWLTGALRRGCPAADRSGLPALAASKKVVSLKLGEVSHFQHSIA
jgi:hypothetical protein